MPDQTTQTELVMIENKTEYKTILWLAFDGASRGNPGPSGCGAYATIKHNQHKPVPFMTMKRSIPPTTNNMAEWKAFVYGLQQVWQALEKTDLVPSQIDIRIKGDSRLVVEQTCGRWKIKDKKFLEWYQQAHHILQQFGKWSMTHVYRQQNTIADELANKAIQS